MDGRETLVAWTRVEAVESDFIQCILGKLNQQDLLVLAEVKEREAPGMALRRTLSLLLIYKIKKRVSGER